jgi:hypothetical protein
MSLDHFSVYTTRAIYTDFNLSSPFFRREDFGGYCIDAPEIIPAGSTKRCIADGGDIFEASTRLYRD